MAKARLHHEVGWVVLLSMLAAAVAIEVGAPGIQITAAPIIGVLGVPAADDCGTVRLDRPRPERVALRGACFESFYVKWIESAGGQVVPVPFDMPHAQLRRLLSQLNGFLFTGGGLDLYLNTTYVQTAKFIYDFALSRKDDYFPVWGTCMGFQLLNILTAWNESVLCSYCYDSENIPLALELTSVALQSRLFRALGGHVTSILSQQNVTMNFHHDGIPPTVSATNPKLAAFYNVLSINHDRKGAPFVSTMEAKEWPIYGVQWHPERNQFEFTPGDDIPHFPDAVKVGQAMAEFFVAETRKSRHSFTSMAELQKLLIYNYCPVNNLYGQQTYYFGGA